ncbi:MAG: AraC family ligand binding domain-containing protein [bacterium]
MKPLQSLSYFQSSVSTPLGRILQAGSHIQIMSVPVMPMRYWEIYSIVYVIDGTGEYCDFENRVIPLKTGDMMMMFPGHGYRYQSDNKTPWSELYMQFDGPVFNLWQKEKVISPTQPVIHLEPVDYWFNKLLQPVIANFSDDVENMLTRIMMLQTVLTEIINHSSQLKVSDNEWLIKAKMKLNSLPLNSLVDWSEISESMYISTDRFRKNFRLFQEYHLLIFWQNDVVMKRADYCSKQNYHYMKSLKNSGIMMSPISIAGLRI